MPQDRAPTDERLGKLFLLLVIVVVLLRVTATAILADQTEQRGQHARYQSKVLSGIVRQLSLGVFLTYQNPTKAKKMSCKLVGLLELLQQLPSL
jgi:hypothetical protein